MEVFLTSPDDFDNNLSSNSSESPFLRWLRDLEMLFENDNFSGAVLAFISKN